MSIRALSPELAEKARVELNEDPKKVKDDIQHLKDWLAKQPHLRARTDDQWLLVFLRGSKFSLERAKQKIDLYYTFRTAAPEFFAIKHTNPKFHEILNIGAMVLIPKTWGPATPVISIVRPGRFDPNKYNMLDMMAISTAIQKILFYENDNASVAGVRGIMDMEGTTMAHFMQMTPTMMKKMAVFSQDAAPLRMKGFHYINTPPGFETIFNLMKGFLNEKNKSRLFVHNKNYDEMYKEIPKEILPAEYGGNSGTMAEITEYWKNKVKEYSAWLDEEEYFGVDESKRPGKPKTAEELFGVEGSFKQLEFIIFKTMSVRPLPPELEEKAREELNEDPKRLEAGIQHLKEWISKQPHLRARTDDQWLAAFLRGCKHSLELAKEKIDLYYSLRSTAPDLFSLKPNDSKFMELLQSGVALVLPKVLKPTDPRVILIRASEYDPNKFVVSELLALTLVMQQILYLEDDSFLVSGVINIVDMQGATVAHFLQMTPTMMKKMLVTGQDASPARLKSAHYLSTPPGFESVLCIGKRIMSEKFKSRLYVHNKGLDDLYKFVPKEILPAEYGGSGGTIRDIIDYWVKKIKEYDEWFNDDQMYGTDENMRAGSPKTPESMFGLDGSFRQLDFD
ncbi:uncharacterized protein LOC106142999 [Amyelois transitella]|uniref:uncharacterized protein LOC106142999 n=1 Tax=Amyelois transitella TaxID=680683 RepID=UPI00298FFC68|nr:uncharacterized protein LOC106142999 [Amyelois transitella]